MSVRRLFDGTNVELILEALDGRALNGKFLALLRGVARRVTVPVALVFRAHAVESLKFQAFVSIASGA